jgi:hypothetical protein
MLEDAGVSYYNPQLGVGEWGPHREAEEMRAKDDASVLLFVLSSETRGVATVGEIAYYMGLGRKLALAVSDAGECFPEHEDLNRGRIFVRTMARESGVPVFADVESAVRHAIELVRRRDEIECVLQGIDYPGTRFAIEETRGGYLIQMCREEVDANSGEQCEFKGRKWFVDREASRADVVRTAFKAVITWEEHEARHRFTYRGERLFDPHFEVD